MSNFFMMQHYKFLNQNDLTMFGEIFIVFACTMFHIINFDSGKPWSCWNTIANFNCLYFRSYDWRCIMCNIKIGFNDLSLMQNQSTVEVHLYKNDDTKKTSHSIHLKMKWSCRNLIYVKVDCINSLHQQGHFKILLVI